MNVRVLESSVTFREQPFVRPLQISSGKITEITEATATVRVSLGGVEAEGRGSIYLSDLWAWPDPALSHDVRDAHLRSLTSEISERLADLGGGESAHPLELGLRLHDNVCAMDSPVPSLLARAMCLSPFDAAIHDAAGVACGLSAFAFYDDPAPIPSADHLFPEGAVRGIRRIIRDPCFEMPAWLIVSRGDDLQQDVRPWIRERGYGCFKVKILGRDTEDDAARTAEVFRAVRAFGVAAPRLTVDSNEGNADARSVRDYLLSLRQRDSEAFEAVEYLEQPTARDIGEHPYDWKPVTALKPVMLDEGLTGLDILPGAFKQGWSGLAMKTCKGHSFALAASAWAAARGMPIALQDLTNPGLSLIHAALFAAHIPTVNGVELNSPQYTPDANSPWLPRHAGLFQPEDGVHRLPRAAVAGLGSAL